MSIDALMSVEVDRALPDAESDSTEKPVRGGRYGEAYIVQTGGNSFHMLADEGTYKIAMTVPGTGITAAINTGISETAGNFLYIKNNDAVANTRSKTLYPHFLRLICTTIPASAASLHASFKLDNRDRYTSGGSQLTVVNPNIGTGQGYAAQIYAGALTTTAPSPSSYAVDRAVMRSVIPVVNDEWLFTFGHMDGGAGLSMGGNVAQRMVIPCPPIVIAPQSNLCMQLWAPSNATTAGVYEVELGFFER